MTEKRFHPFAVLHLLRKTILVYLLPLVQVLFARNWAALWAALAQDVLLLALLSMVCWEVLRVSGWQMDAHGNLLVRWRLGIRLDRTLRADMLAALTIDRPVVYRLAGASRLTLYPAGQKKPLTLIVARDDARELADRLLPLEQPVVHRPHGGEKMVFAVLGANGLSTLALLALALRQSRPYAPDAQTLAFAHLSHLAAFAARWLPMGTAWMLVATGWLFCISLARSAAQVAHYTVWRTDAQLGSRGGLLHRYEMRLCRAHLNYADLRRSPVTRALHYCPVFVTAGSCAPELPLFVWKEGTPLLQELLPGIALPPDTAPDITRRSKIYFLPAGLPLGAVPAADGSVPHHAADPHPAAAGAGPVLCRSAGGGFCGLPPGGRMDAGRSPDPAAAEGVPPALRLCPASGPVPDGTAVPVGSGGPSCQPDPDFSGPTEAEGAQCGPNGACFFTAGRMIKRRRFS